MGLSRATPTGFAVVVAVVSGNASAADLGRPAPMPPPAVVYESRPALWTGFYVGGNVGAAWGGVDFSDVTTGATASGNDSQFTGGGQVGYNWQAGRFVLGVEGGMNWGSSSSSEDFGGARVSLDADWVATLAGRVGFAADNWLFYAKGGAAWVDGSATALNLGTGATASASDTMSGWLAGGGVEWAWSPRWSTRLDYTYIGLDSTNVTLGGTTYKAEPDIQTLTLGLNYRF